MVLEDLHVAGMMKNHAFAASLSDAALGELARQIEYKSTREGGLALWAPRFFPSSKRCAHCGHVESDLALSERTWTCPHCGEVLDRDGNAASNLMWLGRLALGDGELPEDAKPWANWIHDARERVEQWRAVKAVPRGFATTATMKDAVGQAMSELTRGETVNRGGRKSARNTAAEPRTKKARVPPRQSASDHIRARIG